MEVVGAVSGVLTVVSAVTKLAKSLNEVRDRYNNVALNTTLVASQLNSIRAALEAIADWRTTSNDNSKPSRQLDEDLAISLNCCAILITVIDSKLGEAGYTPGMKQKIRHLWLEDVLKEYLSNLEGQVRSLQLLLTIFQCRTSTEQRQKLEQEDSRTVMEQLRAETASLHADSDAISIAPSKILGIDEELMKHPIYIAAYGKDPIIHLPEPTTIDTHDEKGVPQPASTAVDKPPEQSTDSVPPDPAGHSALEDMEDDEKGRMPNAYEHRRASKNGGSKSRSTAEEVRSYSVDEGRPLDGQGAQDRSLSSKDDSISSWADSPTPQLSLDLVHSGEDLGLAITSEGLSRTSFDAVENRSTDEEGIPNEQEIKSDVKVIATDSDRSGEALLPTEEPKNTILQSQAPEPTTEKKQRPMSTDSDLYGASIETASIGDLKKPEPDGSVSEDKVSEEKPADPFEHSLSPSPSKEPSKADFAATISGPFQWHLHDLDHPAVVSPKATHPDGQSVDRSPPIPKRVAPAIPQGTLNVVISDSDDAANPSDENSLPTPSDGGASSDFGHRRSMSSNGESSTTWSERSYSHTAPDTLPEIVNSPPTTISPTSPREQAQLKLQGLQRQLAEAKAKGDTKGAQQSLERSIEIIHQTYLPNAATRPPTTWPPTRKPSERKSLLRLPSLAQLGNRGKKPQIQAFFNAVCSDDVPTIKDYLGQGVSVNVRSENFRTPLMEAAMHGKLRSTEILKQYGADEFAVNPEGRTVLHLAIATKQMYAVQWLLEAYPNDEGQTNNSKSWRLSRSPSSLPIRSPKSLREASDKEGSRPLHVAARQNLTELLVVLTTSGAHVEARDNRGGTPLHAAISTNSLEAAAGLISASAKLDVVDAEGMSPLHRAAKLGHLGAIDLLLKAGAKWSFSGGGDLPIHIAIREGRLNVVENFMFHGVDVEAKTQKGDTLLLIAAQSNQVQIAEFLLKRSANANPFSRLVPLKLKSDQVIATKESNDRTIPPLSTPLHFACFAGWYEMAALLLDHQALVNVSNSDGKSPLILAAEADDTNLVYLLIARGAKVNATIPSNMWNAAHIASMKGNLETLQKLYQAGTNIHARSSDLKTPEEYAHRCGNEAKRQAMRVWFTEIRNLRMMKARQQQQQQQQSLPVGTSTSVVQNYTLNSAPSQHELALIQQLSPPASNQYYDPRNDSFPEAPPPYVAGPSAPARLANRAGVYRPPETS